MSKEMIDLADEAALLAANYETFLYKHVDAWREFCRKHREQIVAALRASTVAEPVGFACSAEIGVNRHHLGLSVEPMGVYDTPVYTHPAPAAPVPASLQGQINAIYGSLDAEDCAWIDREWAKLRNLTIATPEAAPTREPSK